ncbi:MAG: hypothetical protein FWF94_01535 [Oscillospiraceae bacterium]|nr:hypothetical protein [Oscillospiraceae bacterium]
MRSSFMGMEVQKRALQVAQKSIDITGHNINNQDTQGYTRQRVDTHSLNISSFTYWQTRLSKLSLAGQGVSAFGVSQIRNDYLDKRYRDMAPQAKEYDAKVKIMLELETTLDAVENFSLLDAFNNLKSALQQVSLISPDALEMTSMVRNQSENICKMLRSYSADLDKLLQRNIEDLNDSIKGANSLIDRIVQYNKAIVGEYLLDAGRIAKGSSVSEYGPLEMLDARNVLLDELADFANIEVFHNSNGSVRVEMAGITIIDDQLSEKLVMRDYDNYGAAYITFSNGIDFVPSSGEIKAYMDMVGGYGPYAVGAYQNAEFGIPYYMQALNAFAEGFADLMNEINKGYVDEYQAWNRNLLWGGYDIDADGKRVPLLDEDGYKIFLDIDGSRLPPLDDVGNVIEYEGREPLYVKSKVTASNIRISDEWMKDVMMIGQTFDPTIPESIRQYREGAIYSKGEAFFDVATGLYCIVQTDTFTAKGELGQHIQAGLVKDVPVYRDVAPDYKQTSPNFAPNFEKNKANYKEGDVFFDPNRGVYYKVTKNLTAAIGDINTTGWINAVAHGDIEVVGVHEGEWHKPNLDGANLHRFVRALEADRSWGRTFDFGGSVFGYLEFISDRLGQGIEYLNNKLDVTVNTVNILLDNRDAISAVSETEEGINMLTYQKWFNASARLMTTMDDALDTIINRMGRVGL